MLVVPETLAVPEWLIVPDTLWVKLRDRDPDRVASEHGGGGIGDGQVVRVFLTTTVTTPVFGGLVRVEAPLPALAAMPETKAETARSD